jgi:hypothetical protein
LVKRLSKVVSALRAEFEQPLKPSPTSVRDKGGLAPAILNLSEWRHHLLTRLRREADASGDPKLLQLHDELRALPVAASRQHPTVPDPVAVPLRLRHPTTATELSFLSTTTVFGTATNVTLAELTLEYFYPADEVTRHALLAS